MKIKRIGYTFELTPEELERAYREQERNYRMKDAEDHLLQAAEDLVQDELGNEFSLHLDPEKKEDVLEDLVDCFMDEFDCNVPENEIWDRVVQAYLKDVKNK